MYILTKFDKGVCRWRLTIGFRPPSSGRPFGPTKYNLPASAAHLGVRNTTFQLQPAIWAYEIRHSSFGWSFGRTKCDIPAPADHLGLQNTTFQLRPPNKLSILADLGQSAGKILAK